MAHFNKQTGGERKPFGIRRFLRSTKNIQELPWTLSKDSVPSRVLDGTPQKFLQPGTVLAKITSGPNQGKVGPYQAAGTVELQTITKTGTWSGGGYKLTILGVQTDLIAHDAALGIIQQKVDAALATLGLPAGYVVVGGGPLGTTPITLSYVGYSSTDAPAATIDTSAVTGSTPGAGVVTTTAGVPGANDGRQTAANIVGLLKTALPWTLDERDVEVAAVYFGTAVQGWCSEFNASGAEITLSNTTRDAMRTGGAAGSLCQLTFV